MTYSKGWQSAIVYCDGLGDASDKSIATQRLQAERILPWQRIYRQAAT
jgi:hypothetical protein